MANFTVDRIQKQAEGQPTRGTLTPKMAEYFLQHNKENYRSVSDNRAARYANDIRAERWKMNYADNLVVTENGDGHLVLLNGQHRCAGTVRAGKPIDVFVVRVSPKVADASYMDQGAARTVAQILKYEGYDYAATRSAIASQLLKQQGIRQSTITFDMIKAAMKQYESGIQLGVMLPPRVGTTAGLRSAVARAVYSYDTDRVMEFIEQFARGWSGKPEDQMVDRLVRYIAFRQSRKVKVDDKFPLICERAIHAFCEKIVEPSTTNTQLRPAAAYGALLPLPLFVFPGFTIVTPTEKRENRRKERIGKARRAKPGTSAGDICSVLQTYNKPVTGDQIWNKLKDYPQWADKDTRWLHQKLSHLAKRKYPIIERKKNQKNVYVYIYVGD